MFGVKGLRRQFGKPSVQDLRSVAAAVTHNHFASLTSGAFHPRQGHWHRRNKRNRAHRADRYRHPHRWHQFDHPRFGRRLNVCLASSASGPFQWSHYQRPACQCALCRRHQRPFQAIVHWLGKVHHHSIEIRRVGTTLKRKRLRESLVPDGQSHLCAHIQRRPTTHEPPLPSKACGSVRHPGPRGALFDQHGEPWIGNLQLLFSGREFDCGFRTRLKGHPHQPISFPIQSEHIHLRRQKGLVYRDWIAVPSDPQTDAPRRRGRNPQTNP